MNSHNTILLVEDNRDDEKLTISALRDASIRNQIDVVRDGAEALDYLFMQGKYFDTQSPQMVLLDLKLPKVDGIEVLRALRADETTRNIPVVIFTSSREDIDLINSYQLGVNSYIQKPIEFTEFAKAVSQLGLYWIILNQYPPTIKR